MRKLLVVLGAAVAAMTLKRAGASDGGADDVAGALPATTPDRAATNGPTASVQPASPADGDGHRATSPSDIGSSGWKDVAKRTLAEVKADNVPMMAAAVAFAGLLALFPGVIAAMSIYGLVTDPAAAADAATELTAALPADAASLITDQMQSVADSESSALGIALLISVLGALWSASGGMGMLIKALNNAYDEDEDRGFVEVRGLAIAMTLGAIVFFAVSITLIAVVPAVIDGIGLGVVGTVAAQIARWLLLAGLVALALAVLYRCAPDREDAKWRWISPGAVLASVLWLLGSAAFSLFVSNFGSYNETYGAIAGVIVLMLWLQISALVVLLGAELNAETERQTVRDTTTGAPRPMGTRGAAPADEPPPAPGGSTAGDAAGQRVAS